MKAVFGELSPWLPEVVIFHDQFIFYGILNHTMAHILDHLSCGHVYS